VRLYIALCVVHFFSSFACYGAQDRAIARYRTHTETYSNMMVLRSALVPRLQALAVREQVEAAVDSIDIEEIVSVVGIKKFDVSRDHVNTIQPLMQQALADVVTVECASKQDLLNYTQWQWRALGELHRWIGVVQYKKTMQKVTGHVQRCVEMLQQNQQDVEKKLAQLALQRWQSHQVNIGCLLVVSGLLGCSYRSDASTFQQIRSIIFGATAMGFLLEKHRRCLQKIDVEKQQAEQMLQKNSALQKQLSNEELLKLQVQDLFLTMLQASRSNLNEAISGYESRERQRLERERVLRQKQIDRAQQEELHRKKLEEQEKILKQRREYELCRQESAKNPSFVTDTSVVVTPQPHPAVATLTSIVGRTKKILGNARVLFSWLGSKQEELTTGK